MCTVCALLFIGSLFFADKETTMNGIVALSITASSTIIFIIVALGYFKSGLLKIVNKE